jgi:hypothetical protein
MTNIIASNVGAGNNANIEKNIWKQYEYNKAYLSC